jgi:Pentapeptide repeats (9 copies)/BTB/POZ domain
MIRINVGNQVFGATAETLQRSPRLARALADEDVAGDAPGAASDNVSATFDRDPDAFELILKYLRNLRLPVHGQDVSSAKWRALYDEAVYFELFDLVRATAGNVVQQGHGVPGRPPTRKDAAHEEEVLTLEQFNPPLATGMSQMLLEQVLANSLRGSACSFSNVNLDSLSFFGISLFKATFARCSMRGTNLTNCDLRRALFLDVDLRETDLRECSFSNAELDKTLFEGTTRLEPDFLPKKLMGFRIGCNLEDVSFLKHFAFEADFTEDVQFSNTWIAGVPAELPPSCQGLCVWPYDELLAADIRMLLQKGARVFDTRLAGSEGVGDDVDARYVEYLDQTRPGLIGGGYPPEDDIADPEIVEFMARVNAEDLSGD